jgi:hypothetical protein
MCFPTCFSKSLRVSPAWLKHKGHFMSLTDIGRLILAVEAAIANCESENGV